MDDKKLLSYVNERLETLNREQSELMAAQKDVSFVAGQIRELGHLLDFLKMHG